MDPLRLYPLLVQVPVAVLQFCSFLVSCCSFGYGVVERFHLNTDKPVRWLKVQMFNRNPKIVAKGDVNMIYQSKRLPGPSFKVCLLAENANINHTKCHACLDNCLI